MVVNGLSYPLSLPSSRRIKVDILSCLFFIYTPLWPHDGLSLGLRIIQDKVKHPSLTLSLPIHTHPFITLVSPSPLVPHCPGVYIPTYPPAPRSTVRFCNLPVVSVGKYPLDAPDALIPY